MMTNNRLALVTGASGGIGLELARVHAILGGDLILVARSEESLQSLQREWEHMYKVKVYPIPLDLSMPGAGESLSIQLGKLGLSPEYVINNAGLGGLGEFKDQNLRQINQQMMVNMVALTEITRVCLPAMLKAKRGAILQVASVAAFMPGPLQAVYYASKAYVLRFSEALRLELEESGVTVTTLCPGPTESNFLATAGGPSGNVYKAQSAREAAEFGYRAMLDGRSVAIPDGRLAFQVKALPQSLLSRISLKRNAKILARSEVESLVTKPIEIQSNQR
jgi:short-subunit dehydrogenase